MFLITRLTFTFLSVLFLSIAKWSAGHIPCSIPDNSSGYVDVRPSAHMFWWLYGSTNPSIPRDQLPLVMWLQVGNLTKINSLIGCLLGTVYMHHACTCCMYAPYNYIHKLCCTVHVLGKDNLRERT